MISKNISKIIKLLLFIAFFFCFFYVAKEWKIYTQLQVFKMLNQEVKQATHKNISLFSLNYYEFSLNKDEYTKLENEMKISLYSPVSFETVSNEVALSALLKYDGAAYSCFLHLGYSGVPKSYVVLFKNNDIYRYYVFFP
jgi:hypothetical protein